MSSFDDTTNEYKIYPTHDNETYAIEKWTNTISTGKQVTISVTTIYRGGEFTMQLTEEDKYNILMLDKISFDDYQGVCCEELDGGSSEPIEIENIDKYTQSEIDEINERMNTNNEDDSYEYGSDSDCMQLTMRLESNGWSITDTIYGFTCPCNIELPTIKLQCIMHHI
jgi:hypothetical protein